MLNKNQIKRRNTEVMLVKYAPDDQLAPEIDDEKKIHGN
jgi:hypothetical protein